MGLNMCWIPVQILCNLLGGRGRRSKDNIGLQGGRSRGSKKGLQNYSTVPYTDNRNKRPDLSWPFLIRTEPSVIYAALAFVFDNEYIYSFDKVPVENPYEERWGVFDCMHMHECAPGTTVAYARTFFFLVGFSWLQLPFNLWQMRSAILATLQFCIVSGSWELVIRF